MRTVHNGGGGVGGIANGDFDLLHDEALNPKRGLVIAGDSHTRL